jgi:hypothetical protein
LGGENHDVNGIFGAGASYDSSPIYKPGKNSSKIADRPPLASELFEAREDFLSTMRLFKRCQAVIPFLQRKDSDVTVEQVLRRLQDEASSDPERYRQLAAIRYYLQYMIWMCQSEWVKHYLGGISNYKALLDEIRHCRKTNNPVCLVTFNYDTLLDDELPSVGVEIVTMADYINSSNYKLIKPHGSINWGREIRGKYSEYREGDLHAFVNELIAEANELEISQVYRLISNNPIPNSSGTVTLFPALAIPVEAKSEFECPSDHLDVLCKMLPEVDSIITIGWRATEQHFLKLLKQYLAHHVRVKVVAANEGQETINNMKKAGIDGTFFDTECGFTEFVVSRQAADFLITCGTL